ncbi:MAG: SppA protein [Saprospiraceae bacterium]|nr:SppA protein [Saprospiraceae bacterium]
MVNFNKSLSELINDNKSDFYLYVGTINDVNADKFIDIMRKNDNRRDNCSLILTTYGGDPDAGYRIIRAIKRYYSHLTLYIFGSCKSTGTLMALGADQIVMSDFGEFGPLDIQLTKDDELSNTSGLNFVQSLMSLNEQLFRAFEENFLGLKRRSRNTITTRTAAEICSKLAVGLISPISAQIDPVKLGEVQRAIKIANEYGSRLCDRHDLIAKLIVGYPSHGFVIDFVESQEIFGNVRWVSDHESILEQFLLKLVRNEGEEDYISELKPEIIEPKKSPQFMNTEGEDIIENDNSIEIPETNFNQVEKINNNATPQP